MAFHALGQPARWRSFTALNLILALVLTTVPGVRLAASHGDAPARTPPQTKYESMTLEELRAVLNQLSRRNLELGMAESAETKALRDTINPLVSERVDLNLQLFDRNGEVEALRAQRKQISEQGDFFGRLSESDAKQIDRLDETIRRLNEEIARMDGRKAELVRQISEAEARLYPASQAAEARLAAERATVEEEFRIARQVAERKFGRDAAWTIERVQRPAAAGRPLRGDTIDAPVVERPPRTTIDVNEPAAGTRQGMLWRTLKRGLVDVVYERIPAFAGAVQQALLVAFDEGRAKVREYLLRQGRAEIATALASESAELRAALAPTIEAVVDAHAGRVADVAVDQGNIVIASQTPQVRQQLGRGRFMAEWWEKAKTSLQEGKAGRVLYGINALFIVVAIWDIGTAIADGNYATAAGMAGALVVISVGLHAAEAAKWTLLATGANAVLFVVALCHILSRASSFIADTYNDYVERPWVAFILDGERCVMDGPKGQKVDIGGIGFFNFPLSPAYGLSRDTWFLQFPTRDALHKALRDYRAALAYVFQGQWNVPPLFDPGENMVMFEKLVGREWTTKWKAHRDKVQADLEKIRDEMDARVAGLTYPVRNLPLPEPTGHLFGILMGTDVPTTGNDIEFRQVFGVTGLPGDASALKVRSEVVRAGGQSGIAPLVDSRDFKLELAEGIKIYTGKTKVRVTEPGDYEYVVSMDVEGAGVDPEPRRYPFRVAAPEIPTPCGFNFFAPFASDELKDALDEKLRSALPTLPKYGQSQQAADGRLLTSPSSGQYGVEDSGLVSIEAGTKETFSLRWSVGFNIYDTRDTRSAPADRLHSDQQMAIERLKKNPDFVDGPVGETSWLGATGSRGTLDPANFGDPYTGTAVVSIVDCLNIEVQAGVAAHPPVTHGPRTRPEVITALREAAKSQAIGAARALRTAASAALQETVPLMRQRAAIVTPTPGQYHARLAATADRPAAEMTLIVRAGEGKQYTVEGTIIVDGISYPFTGNYTGYRDDLSMTVSVPKPRSGYLSAVYRQYRRGFNVSFSLDERTDSGSKALGRFDMICRYVGP